MIKKTIGKLRRQPKRVREGIAFWFTCAFVFMVSSIWLFNVPAQFADLKLVSSEDSEPIKSFFDELSSQSANATESLTGSENASSSAGLGNESLDNLVDQFRERASSSAGASLSSQASSSLMTSSSSLSASTSASFEQPAAQSTTTLSAPAARGVRIVTTASSSASSSVGR